MKTEPLYLKIYHDILLGMKTGVYPAGSRLPSEKELSEQYQVSRITSKKAMEMLADRNMITRIPGKGSYVLDTEGSQEEPEAVKPEEAGRMIGFVMDTIGIIYGSGLLSGIEYECRRKGFTLALRCTYGSVEEETKALEDMVALGVSGILLMCVEGETYSEAVLRLLVEKYPIVLVDRALGGLPLPFVGTDNYSAAKELVDILIGKGHREICFLSHPFMKTSTVEARFSGYRDSYMEHNLLTNETMWITDIGFVRPWMDENEDAESRDVRRMESFVERNGQISAYLSVDYAIGVMMYKILKKMGLEKEKEVVFFDGPDEIIDSNPIFTHVMQGEYLIGVKSVKRLADVIKGREVPETTYIPYRIVLGKED